MACDGRHARSLTGRTYATLLVLVAWLAPAMLGGDGAHGQEAPAERLEIDVAVHDGRMSARVDAAPLESILQAIVAQSDLAIEVSGDLGMVRPQEFSDLPLEAGLRRLIGDRGLIMIYDRPESDHRQRLSRVRVYGDLAPDPAGRQVHVQQARTVASREATPTPSYAELAAESKEMRLRTIRRLARRKDEVWVQVLSTVVAQDPEASIRRVAASALGTIGGAEAAAALETALTDQDADVRVAAVRGLRSIKGEDAAARLSEVASSDRDLAVRRQVILLLGTLKSNTAWSTIQAATTDSDQTVREAAERMLSRQR